MKHTKYHSSGAVLHYINGNVNNMVTRSPMVIRWWWLPTLYNLELEKSLFINILSINAKFCFQKDL